LTGQVGIAHGGRERDFHRLHPVTEEAAPPIKLPQGHGQLPGREAEIGFGGQLGSGRWRHPGDDVLRAVVPSLS
jgi:hypothetical protein